MKPFELKKIFATFFVLLFLVSGNSQTVHARDNSCSIEAYEFYWSGQFAGFIVNGRFSFDRDTVPANGIVREEDLLSFDVSFYDPQGNHLRTYYDNHNLSKYPSFNFAFDTLTEQILEDGTWSVDDDNRRFRNGFLMGEGDPELRSVPGSQTGLAFWSRPGDDKVPHLHVDDWDDANGNGEFGFPIGFSSHEDAAFLTKTTEDRVNTGKVGTDYYDEANGINNLASDFGSLGRRIKVVPAAKTPFLDFRTFLKCRTVS